MGVVIQFSRAAPAAASPPSWAETDWKMFERPAAKSSTSVLASSKAVACQRCGCRPGALIHNAMSNKTGCTCKCHQA